MTLCTSCGFTIDGPLHREAGCTGEPETAPDAATAEAQALSIELYGVSGLVIPEGGWK